MNVYKERGYTSHDVVAKLRGIVKQKRIGHTGTLDPEAEGVLPVCLGTATRVCELLTDERKTYRATLRLGVETDTEDLTGTVLRSEAVSCTAEEAVQCILSFQGEILQIPPMYSARKVHGKKLYELARQGMEVEREARPVTIDRICVETVELPQVIFTVTCSKGTYIRTLCADIGKKLGCGGCMEALVRTAVGPFDLAHAIRLGAIEQLRDEGRLSAAVLPTDAMFQCDRALHVQGESEKRVKNGNPLVLSASEYQKLRPENAERFRVYSASGEFLALYTWRLQENCFRPVKMFV